MDFILEEDRDAEESCKSEEVVAMLRQADVLIAQGTKIPDVVMDEHTPTKHW